MVGGTATQELGFFRLQLIKDILEDVILDSGSTISLFQDARMLEDIKESKIHLVMKTNAGRKQINKKGNIPGFSEVWYNPTVVLNLFYLLDMIRRGHQVTINTKKVNMFYVHMKNGNVIIRLQ